MHQYARRKLKRRNVSRPIPVDTVLPSHRAVQRRAGQEPRRSPGASECRQVMRIREPSLYGNRSLIWTCPIRQAFVRTTAGAEQMSRDTLGKTSAKE